LPFGPDIKKPGLKPENDRQGGKDIGCGGGQGIIDARGAAKSAF